MTNNGVRHNEIVCCEHCGRPLLKPGLGRHLKTHGVAAAKPAKPMSDREKLLAHYRKG